MGKEKANAAIYRAGRQGGLQPVVVGNLPPQCAALNVTNVLVQGLVVEASFSGAVLTLNEIREMTAEMLEAEKNHLPQFAGKTLRKAPVIKSPKNVKRQDILVDPTLKIANRLINLAKA